MRRLLLVLALVLAACPGSKNGPPPAPPVPETPADVPLEEGEEELSGEHLFAGMTRVTVPDGPDLVLLDAGGTDAVSVSVLAFGAGLERTEVLSVPSEVDAKYALLIVPDGAVVARLVGTHLKAWCLRWQPKKQKFQLMATYDGAQEDEQPFWLPDELAKFEE